MAITTIADCWPNKALEPTLPGGVSWPRSAAQRCRWAAKHDSLFLTGRIRSDTVSCVYQLQSTDVFDQWLHRLQDRKARARILARLESAQLGNLGDIRSVGEGIREMRVDFGPGYRVYFAQRGRALLLLLCGGDKSTQARDIAKARQVLRDLGKE